MDSSLTVLHKIVTAANMRQKVLASNVANADTPGYKARDIRFGEFLNNEMKMLTTQSNHMASGEQGTGSGTVTVEPTLSWGDKNNVELNAEIAKMTENTLRHDAAIKLINSKIKMFRNAIRGR
jgi:flagellar basal-body rod protein FlgB